MSSSLQQSPPSSIRNYVAGVASVLAKGCWPKALSELKLFEPGKARPDSGESLMSWIEKAAVTRSGRLPLTVIIGETTSDYRQERQPRRRSHSPMLSMASTCDGVAAMRALVPLLRRVSGGLRGVDFDAIVDEWATLSPTIPERVRASHLMVIGTPEVNVFACFLHGLVQDLHFGRTAWPPDLESTGDRVSVARQPYLRCPKGDSVNHGGAVVLLKNPWNPKYRVLWIAGLSGRGTVHGCSLVADGWRAWRKQAASSIAVVFDGNATEVRPRCWLRRNGGLPRWQETDVELPPPPPPPRRPRFDVFLSYHSQDIAAAKKLRKQLVARRLKVWFDEDQIVPGEDWIRKLETGIRDSSCAVVLVGRHGLGRWEKEEIKAALIRAVNSKRVLIPVLLRSAPRRPRHASFLESRQWLDLGDGGGDGIKRLVAAISGAAARAR